jgi:CotH kinase protein/Lamin Tail Domain/Fn3 associated
MNCISRAFLAASIAAAAHATTIYESSRHDIAVGPWGVAWISGGEVMLSNGINTVAPLVVGVNVTKIIGADVTGDGQQEVCYVANGGLYYYDFATQSTSGPFGASINDLTAGKFLNTSTRDTVMVSNLAGSTGQLFAFDGAANSFTALGGAGIRSMSRGNHNTANSVDEFVVVNTSNQPYLFTPNGTGGGAFSGPLGGAADYQATAGGNISAAAGDELWVQRTSLSITYLENVAGAPVNIGTGGGAGTSQVAIATGNLDGGPVEAFVIGGGTSNILYRWRTGTGYDIYPAGNSGWSTFIVGNFDGDAEDEIFAVKLNEPNAIYRFDPPRGDATFSLVVQPTGDGPSAALLGNGNGQTPTLDGWSAIMIVNESDTYTNNSGVPEQVTVGNFDVYIGAVRGRVTPFIVRVLGDNLFTTLAIGTTRVAGVDYTAVGPKSYPFAAAPFVVTLNPGEKLAMGYTDANPNGTGNAGSVVPFTDGGDQIWLTGGPAASNAGTVNVGAAPAQGAGGTSFTTLTRAYAVGLTTTIIPLSNVPPRNLLLSNVEIAAGASAGTTVGALTTDDRNSGDTHTYALVTNPGGTFALGGSTLSLATAAGPPGTAYTVRIRSTDNGGLSLERDFVITAFAPQPPSAIASTAEVIVAGSANGTVLGAFTTTDPNSGDTHTYSLVPGDGSASNALFSISGASLILAAPVPGGATTLSFRVRATDGGGLFLEVPFTLAVLPGGVRINEFVASNDTGIQDEDGAREDWLEIYNPTTAPVDLAGWRLTDDAQDASKWIFPSRTIPAGGYLVVFASQKDRRPAAPANLHTNFKLDGAGEYLALHRPDGVLADVFQPRDQSTDIAFGWGATGRGYLTPTSAAANGAVFPYGQNNVFYSVQRGFYTAAQTLTLTAAIPGSVIKYTTDGTKPAAANGATYSGPIAVAPETNGQRRGTRRVRAVALHSGAAATKAKTHTYLFINGVISPATDGMVSQTNSNNSPQTDAIKASATYAPLLDDALLALPYIVFNNPSGVPTQTESETSVELIAPGGTEAGFQINCGIQAVGNASIASPKNNFRLYMRAQYGDTKLKYNMFAGHPYDPHGATDTFDRLNVRSCSHDSFHWLADPGLPPSPYFNADALCMRNNIMDDLQFQMGKMSTHGRYVHCIVNGQYHGLYHIREYPNDDFFASYLPGGASAFEWTNGANAAENGSGNWQAIWNAIKAYGTTTGAANYAEFKRRVNVADLADFVVLNWWAGNDWDWNPNQNWYGGGPSAPDAGGWRFFSYDNDIIWTSATSNTVPRNVPDGMFNTLMAVHPDFQQLVRDRAYRHMRHDGVLTSAKVRATLEYRENQILLPMVAETARWQPNAATSLPWDRDGEWRAEINRMKNVYFPGRCATVLQQIRNQGWYPVDAPEFTTQRGGSVAEGHPTDTTSPSTIYATTNGADPRLDGGAISPSAFAFTAGGITINANTLVRLRSRNVGGQWSPLNEATFTLTGTVPAGPSNICITELHYHPELPAGQEFIEVMNVGAAPADLSGAQFANGLDYEFPANTVMQPGARIVVTQSQFQNGSNLSNGGERITLVAADLTTIIRDFTFGDAPPWPAAPDGGGPSLVLKNPGAANATDAYHNAPASWRSSTAPGGNSGGADAMTFTGIPDDDLDSDGLIALLEYGLGTSDTNNAQGLNAYSFTRDALTPGAYLFTYQRATAADDVVRTVEQSADLATWTQTGVAEINVVHAGGIETITCRITPPVGARSVFVHIKVVKP